MIIKKLFYKEKTYSFNKNGLDKLTKDIKSKKQDKIIDVGIYSIFIILFVSGMINYKWIINYIACDSTSRIVKLMIK